MTEAPGPGYYNYRSDFDLPEHGGSNAYADTNFLMQLNAARTRQSAVFESRTGRDSLMQEIKQKAVAPGPGYYNLPPAIKVEEKPAKVQNFSSSGERFRDVSWCRAVCPFFLLSLADALCASATVPAAVDAPCHRPRRLQSGHVGLRPAAAEDLEAEEDGSALGLGAEHRLHLHGEQVPQPQPGPGRAAGHRIHSEDHSGRPAAAAQCAGGGIRLYGQGKSQDDLPVALPLVLLAACFRANDTTVPCLC